MKKLAALLCIGCSLTLAAPATTQAFCGFYVTGADTSLYANATMVVLMRDGTRTVLSMQNNYEGPPEEFALVIPVPTVLNQDMVQTLPRDVFERVDSLAAPRLVEYWEGDPCAPPPPEFATGVMAASAPARAEAGDSVTIEAQFAVGEYDVVILSASDSSGLESWLHDNEYNIPDGASSVLDPYVAAGTKFFVAKVDPSRVMFQDGQAALSPLRFYYDTPEFSLPIRLGLLNSQGTQDLIVSILARSRYEVANHPNVLIPTNLRVQDEVRDDFPGFYEALFSKVMEKHPGAVVTEYSWSATGCDPCPTPPLSPQDLTTLGADVTAQAMQTAQPVQFFGYTLTRLHYRYTQETLGEDLVFKEASGLIGGRGIPDPDGKLPETEQYTNAGGSSFQGRYVILHPWDKKISCQEPVRGRWGGPDDPNTQPNAMAAPNTALVGAPARARGALATLVAEPIASLDVMPETAKPSDTAQPDAGAERATNTLDPGAVTPNTNNTTGTPGVAQVGSAGNAATSDNAKAASAAREANDAGLARSVEPRSGCACQLTAPPTTPYSLAWLVTAPALWLVRRRRNRTTRSARDDI